MGGVNCETETEGCDRASVKFDLLESLKHLCGCAFLCWVVDTALGRAKLLKAESEKPRSQKKVLETKKLEVNTVGLGGSWVNQWVMGYWASKPLFDKLSLTLCEFVLLLNHLDSWMSANCALNLSVLFVGPSTIGGEEINWRLNVHWEGN
jgi:hypothetical protein